MRSRDEIRDERESYYGDAIYDAWRRGVDVDRIDRDLCDRHYYEGHQPEAVASELQAQDRRRREAREQEECEEYEEYQRYQQHEQEQQEPE